MSKWISRSGPASAGGLDVHLAEFLATLAAAGYAEKTQQDKRRAISPFIRCVRDAGIAVADLDDARAHAFLKCWSRRPRGHRESARAALLQFLEHRRAVGVVPPRRSVPVSSPAEVLVQRYLDHLRDDRGLCVRSIEVYSPFVRAFVVAQRLPAGVLALDPSAVRSYLLDQSQSRSVSFVKLLTAALRSFLSFYFLDGATATDLSRAVPPVRRWRLAPVPPLVTAEEVERVIAAADRSTPRGRRAFAILLLLARLGLRAGEVVALELDDIHWDVGEIVVRGQGPTPQPPTAS